MNVEIRVWNDLCRPVVGRSDVVIRFVYVDRVSDSHRAACDRAWRITSAAIMRLDGEDLEIRMKWESVAGGLTVSVGDVVVVDGVGYRCVPGGWAGV